MAITFARVIEIYKLCGHPSIDAETVQVWGCCLSTNPTISELTVRSDGRKIKLTKQTVPAPGDFSNLQEIIDNDFLEKSRLNHANTRLFQIAGAKCAVYCDAGEAFIGYVESENRNQGEMSQLMNELASKMADEGYTLFWILVAGALQKSSIEAIVSNYTTENVGIYDMYWEV
jgi:hypothetical protein